MKRLLALSGVAAALLLSLLLPRDALAHAFTPALLDLREWPDGRVDLVLKTSLGAVDAVSEEGSGVQPGVASAVRPVLPEHCHEASAVQRVDEQTATIERWTVTCGPRGLRGATLTVPGLHESGRSLVIRYDNPAGARSVTVLSGDDQETVLGSDHTSASRVKTSGAVGWSYLKLGVEHIALGIDHLLFVLCLVLLEPRLRRLAGTITAFTAAHSLTLALAVLGVLRVPQPPVEALVALSIVLLAAKAATPLVTGAAPTPRAFWRMSFAFGLLHGLGFAGALAELGVPQGQIGLALFSFNVGVEIGQIAFVGAVLLVLVIVAKLAKRAPALPRRAMAYAAGVAGAYFCVDRVAAFWS